MLVLQCYCCVHAFSRSFYALGGWKKKKKKLTETEENPNTRHNWGGVGVLWPNERTCKPKVAGLSLRSGRDCRWGEWMSSTFSTLNTTTEVRPLSKALNPQLLPRHRRIKWLTTPPGVCVCVCLYTTHCCVCVHLDGLNAEHKFRVWVTILGPTSRSFLSFSVLCVTVLRAGPWHRRNRQMLGAPKWVKIY